MALSKLLVDGFLALSNTDIQNAYFDLFYEPWALSRLDSEIKLSESLKGVLNIASLITH